MTVGQLQQALIHQVVILPPTGMTIKHMINNYFKDKVNKQKLPRQLPQSFLVALNVIKL